MMAKITSFVFDKITVLLAVSFSIMIMIIYLVISSGQQRITESIALQNANLMSEVLANVKAIYTTEVADRAQKNNLKLANDYSAMPDAIPFPETFSWLLAKRISHQSNGFNIHLYSPYQYPWDQVDDAFQKKAIDRTMKNQAVPYYQFVKITNQPYLRYAQGITVDLGDCVECTKQILKQPPANLTLGDNSGVMEFDFPLSPIRLAVNEGFTTVNVMVLLYAILGVLSLAYIVGRLRFESEKNRSAFIELEQKTDQLKQSNNELLLQQKELAISKAKAEESKMKLEKKTSALESTQVATLNMMQDMDEARREADSANRSKSQFLANMSHEIRTPMNGVLGMLSLVLDTDLDRDQKEYLEIAENSAKTLLALLNDILDFSKIEAGKLEFENIDFDLRRTVETAAQLLSERAHEKYLELAISIDPNTPEWLKGDPARLRQVMVNLLSNAIKFTEQGEVIIRTFLEEEKNDKVILRFEIQDTGIGISAENQKKLFQSFSQADASMTRKYGGTGLGLAVCKSLVEHMNGRVGIISTEGKGSIFWFTAEFDKSKGRPVAFEPDKRLRGKKVLVVDDNATNRQILEHMFSNWSLDCSAVESGADALDLMHSLPDGQNFEVAVLDLLMPQMDGFELAKKIKADEKLKSTHLIMLSSSGSPEHARQGKECGIEIFFHKPVRQIPLHDGILEVLGYKHISADQSEEQEELPTIHLNGDEIVLLAEDNVVNQKVFKGMLKRIGFHIDVANNGIEAVELFGKNPKKYQLIFMDCLMPEMDGFQATQAIRQLEQPGEHIPIIALTAHTIGQAKDNCIAAGMDDFVSKPISNVKLITTLARWFKSTENKNIKATVSLAEHQFSPTREVVDEHIFNEFKASCSDPEDFREIVQSFLDNSLSLIQTITEGCKSANFTQIQNAAHQLKSTSATLGAMALSGVAKALEHQAKDRDDSMLQRQADELTQAFVLVQDFFKNH